MKNRKINKKIQFKNNNKINQKILYKKTKITQKMQIN